GSAPRAAEGAACAAAAAVGALDRALSASGMPRDDAAWRALLAVAASEARAALEFLVVMAPPAAGEPAPEAAGTDPLRALATTLLLVVVTPARVAALQIGDGAVVIEDGLGQTSALTAPDYGEYLNETVFLTSPDYLERAQVAIAAPPALRGVALFTDGIQMLALNLADGTPHGPFFAPLFSFAAGGSATDADLAAFLQSDRVNARTDDDKTLLLAVRA
ncbi:MAG TPA: protein phosphatase 2C domain-containing protein, partial [Chloroflexia bacterium]|nr:protein phosphatase 2C domain-containing protein [Chloroflexia bacterium]